MPVCQGREGYPDICGNNGSDEGDSGEGNGNNKCPNCGHEHQNNKSRQGQKDISGNDRYGKYGKNDAEKDRILKVLSKA